MSLLSSIFSLIFFGISNNENPVIASGIYTLADSTSSLELYYAVDEDTYYLNPEPIVSVADFEEVNTLNDESGTPVLEIFLNDTGAENLKQASANAEGDRWAFVINGELWSIVTVWGAIPDGKLWLSTGSHSLKQLKEVRKKLLQEMEILRD